MKKVLLIEDDKWLLDSYAAGLSGHYAVTTARDADSAIRAIEMVLPDAIVADIMLEGHTIFSLLHELQSYDDTKKIPVVLCSTLGLDVLKDVSLEVYGVVRALPKTILTPEVLRQSLEEVVTK